MLDTETKRRIDTARDILVGKVPDPKSQVEQITIALIYKFMDDMDAEAEELGGKRKFFTGDYARYGWAKLMDRGLGGHEMLALYAEGITKMPENPGIPLLFREIFKNAFLPYRDPETLKAFLKTIDEFTYDHSERLGDAFEYLLSVLGSQGDAGQFRTPRHIIDFMVAVVDPRKTETVLDPACGTAGFLISSYKHILRANAETPLTPDERGRLALNFKGYDISPDMVRLSLVNLYLHGFTDPHIYEYDTLTSEERWNEYADVILANPPFMSPKGGIKPHKRFSIQAKRSEVLFVDYMAEHLTPNGRAAIIVPEGVIFQSQTAYKDLRRMLVENYLVAVVSLPAGCFNPYSGVKTSILILDKSLARQCQTIAFFKVENDGFGLGAQRRAIEKNDLPQVEAELKRYLQGLRTGQFSAEHDRQHSTNGAPTSQQSGQDAHSSRNDDQFSSANGAPLSQPGATPQENAPPDGKGLKARTNANDRSGLQPSGDFPNHEPGAMPQAGMGSAVGAQFISGLIVLKEKIAANGDYNLSGERYRENGAKTHLFPLVKIADVSERITKGSSPNWQGIEYTTAEKGLLFITSENVGMGSLLLEKPKYVERRFNEIEPKSILQKGDVLTNIVGASIGRTAIFDLDEQANINQAVCLIRLDQSKAEPKYLMAILNSPEFIQKLLGNSVENARANVSMGVLGDLMIPLPPLEVQKEIVAEIEGYQKVINGARAVLDHYRPHIPIHPDWPEMALGEVCRFIDYRGKTPEKTTSGIPLITAKNVREGYINPEPREFIAEDDYESWMTRGIPQVGDVLFTTEAPLGNVAEITMTGRFALAQRLIALCPNRELMVGAFLKDLLLTRTLQDKIFARQSGTTVYGIKASVLKEITIPLPPLATQQAIVAEIEAEQALVAANRELIARFERKIQTTLARIWGEAESTNF